MRRREGRLWAALFYCLVLAACSGHEDLEEATPVASAAGDSAPGQDGASQSFLSEALAAAQPCGGDCSEEGGYRWALQQEITNPELCDGPLPFMEGCRRYAAAHEDSHDMSR